MNKNLDKLLEFLEEKIDLSHIKKVEELHIKAIKYEEVPFLPLTTILPVHTDERYPYKEAFDNPAKMMYNELISSWGSAYRSVVTKDYFPLQIRSNHGIGIIPSLFGLNCRIINDNMPWVDHVDGIEEIKKIINKGIPRLDSALGKKVIDTHQFYLDKLSKYPKCSQAIHITQPDMQGPFDIAHLISGTDIFYYLYDYPEIIHELLELITITYIEFRKFIEKHLADKAEEDSVYLHGAIYGGKVLIKDDTAMVNLSGDMYREFSMKYNNKIYKEFSGSLHYCGPENNWHNEVIQDYVIKSINFGNSEMHDLASTYKRLKAKKISIIMWGDNKHPAFISNLPELGIKTGITLATKVNTVEEAIELIKRHEEGQVLGVDGIEE
jgi:hypothetical protein